MSRAARCALALGLLAVLACKREVWPGPTPEAEAPTMQAVPAPPPPELPVATISPGGHPRILLDEARLEAVAESARRGTAAWSRLADDCKDKGDGKADSGYQGEQWGIAALDLALCWRVRRDDGYAKAAVGYLMALVDDHENVGDGQGGLPAVKENDGYPIRYRGFFAAIAYDWLFEKLTAEQKAHLQSRFVEFCHWYRQGGYKTDDPIANHYMGYFGACAMGGAALDGDDPRGAELRQIARAMWRTEIVPAYAKLAGGDFPEGWQYARFPVAAIALYVDAEGRASKTTAQLADQLPWLRASVAFQSHALQPDGVHLWDSADWSHKPARLFPEMLFATALALPADDPAGKQALFLARLVARPDDLDWNFLHAIADDPSRTGEDPRKGATSYFARGTGTVLARTAWTGGAAWVAMNSGPPWGDHQHLDQGHFEVVRGGDRLIIDPGDYDSYSTMSHNSILVDDAHENLRWTPNQGIWGKNCTLARFEDAGGLVTATADFGAAYNPDGYPEDHPARSVLRAERELVFSRAAITGAHGVSARMVLYDRVTLAKPSYGATWEAHASVTPLIAGNVARVNVGTSSVAITRLEPAGAQAQLLREPTVHSDDMFTKNDPAEGIASTRLEEASPKGAIERRFLHVIAIGGSSDAFPPATKIDGEGAEGAAFDGEAYLFPIAGPQSKAGAAIAYRAPIASARQVVTGLAPNAKYTVSAARDGDSCRVALRPGGAWAASASGVLTLAVHDCTVAP